MCVNLYKIRHCNVDRVQNAGKQVVFAPCGHCEDCRNKQRYAWAWRLTSEVQFYVTKKNYRVGFVTLTYNDDHLPRFPECFDGIAGLPCFSKEDTEKLILYLRKVGYRKYGLTDILYFLASEYGPVTRRPHYHAIFGWDGGKCTAEQFFELIRHYWCEYASNGFISPRCASGAPARHIMPFEVGNIYDCLASCFYTAKYVTKDIYFMRDILDKINPEDLRDLKPYLPHHRQKKSLGFASIASLSDAEKMDVLNRGRSFLGASRLSMPPQYIQDKLMFQPCYIFDSKGNRLVRRKLTDFMERNVDEILKNKVGYYESLFEKMRDVVYWTSTGISEDRALEASSFIRDNDYIASFGCSLAEAYVFYYGLRHCYCFLNKRLTFVNRYRHPAKVYSSLLIDFRHWKNIQEFFGYLMSFTSWQNESIHDENVDIVKDKYNISTYKDEV